MEMEKGMEKGFFMVESDGGNEDEEAGWKRINDSWDGRRKMEFFSSLLRHDQENSGRLVFVFLFNKEFYTVLF